MIQSYRLIKHGKFRGQIRLLTHKNGLTIDFELGEPIDINDTLLFVNWVCRDTQSNGEVIGFLKKEIFKNEMGNRFEKASSISTKPIIEDGFIIGCVVLFKIYHLDCSFSYMIESESSYKIFNTKNRNTYEKCLEKSLRMIQKVIDRSQ